MRYSAFKHELMAGVLAGRYSAARGEWYCDDVLMKGWKGVPTLRSGHACRYLIEMRRDGWIEVPDPAPPPPPPSWLYVVAVGDRVKPGRSTDPAARLRQHHGEAAKWGAAPGDEWVSAAPVGTADAEAALLDWCGRQPGVTRHGREWFRGLSFAGTVAAAAQIEAAAVAAAPPPPAPAEVLADGRVVVRATPDGRQLYDERERRARLVHAAHGTETSR